MNVSKEFILKMHKAARSGWKEKIEAEFPELFGKPQLKQGKWYHGGTRYHGHGSDNTFLMRYNGGSTTHGFWRGLYGNHFGFNHAYDATRLATNKEVAKVLAKEAKRRGLKHGNFKCLIGNTSTSKDGHPKYEFLRDNTLWIYNNCCFNNGKWATINK